MSSSPKSAKPKSFTVISYVPALHQGYLNFFSDHPGRLFVLDLAFVRETPRLERDIRALDAETVAKMIEALGAYDHVSVLTKTNISRLEVATPIVMPDEDVNRNFANQYLRHHQVQYIPTFLRWDGHNAQKQSVVQAHQNITTGQLDQKLMRIANDAARRSPDWWRQIGGVIAREGKPILIGHNRPLPEDDYWLGAFGDPRSNFDYGVAIELSTALHAEAGLIAEAARRGLKLEGTSLYVSTFPCPMCAKSIAAAGIKTVYFDQGYSLLDAEDIMKSHSVKLIHVEMRNPSASTD